MNKRLIFFISALMCVNILAFAADISISNFKVKFGEDIYGSDPNYMRVSFDIDAKQMHGQHCLIALSILDENHKYLPYKGDDYFKNTNDYFFKQEGFWRNGNWTQTFDISKSRLTFLPKSSKAKFYVAIYVTENGQQSVVARYRSGVYDMNQEFAKVANVSNAKKVSTPIASSSSKSSSSASSTSSSSSSSKSTPTSSAQTASQKSQSSSAVNPASVAASMPKLELTAGLYQVSSYIVDDEVIDIGDPMEFIRVKKITISNVNGVMMLSINFDFNDYLMGKGWDNRTENYKLTSSAKYSASNNYIKLTGLSSKGSYPASGILKSLYVTKKSNGDYLLYLGLEMVYGDSEDCFRITSNGKKLWDYLQTLHSKHYF